MNLRGNTVGYGLGMLMVGVLITASIAQEGSVRSAADKVAVQVRQVQNVEQKPKDSPTQTENHRSKSIARPAMLCLLLFSNITPS